MGALLDPGTEIDGFRIEQQIYAGGMAIIYRVSGHDAAFPIVMKVPRLGFGEPAESVVSFEVEQLVLAALQGPHVPRFVASGDITRQPYLVMEHVEGCPLSEWVERAPLEPGEIARLGAALGTALHSLHLQEAIHLDVKPSNVMIRPSGEAVLIDFGLARHAHYPDLLAEEIRSPIGSAPYISPEQVMGVRWDPRSDVFALGVVLYELATARHPFGTPSKLGALRKRLWRDPVPPRAIVRAVPEWLQEVILRCLEPDPDQRYPSAAQVAFDLADPEQIGVGLRGRKLRRDGRWKVFRRYFRAVGLERGEAPAPTQRLAGPAIVLVAIATQHADDAQLDALREAVRRIRAAAPEQRLACITVIKPSPELGGSSEEEAATSQRIKHVILLRHWAEPLALEAGQISFHVIESNEPADAILKFARMNQVDQIVIGAPPRDVPLRGMLGTVSSRVAPEAAPEPLQFLRLLGTVSTKVAAEAPCTVTVVRPRGVTPV
ncbi:MAG TPA: bifunctional serine/threonine-protein kinase/universal stress protein [Anaeromyxobacter sp.]